MSEAISNTTGAKRKFSSREEWHDFIRSTAGSITDETFVRPNDAYFEYGVSFDEPSLLSRQ